MSSRRWQFSVRSLLALTTVVAMLLCLAVSVPLVFGLLVVMVAVVLGPIGAMYFSERLVSGRHPVLAAVTWSFVGAICAGSAWLVWAADDYGRWTGQKVIILVPIASCMVLALLRAAINWNRGCRDQSLAGFDLGTANDVDKS